MDEKHNTLLARGADNDVVRLRWRIKIRENVVARLQAENERLRLTGDEREAIEAAADLLIGSRPGATLRSLLARLS
jgi:hypothetical protein